MNIINPSNVPTEVGHAATSTHFTVFVCLHYSILFYSVSCRPFRDWLPLSSDRGGTWFVHLQLQLRFLLMAIELPHSTAATGPSDIYTTLAEGAAANSSPHSIPHSIPKNHQNSIPGQTPIKSSSISHSLSSGGVSSGSGRGGGNKGHHNHHGFGLSHLSSRKSTAALPTAGAEKNSSTSSNSNSGTMKRFVSTTNTTFIAYKL
jgi:hypothetical protein